MDHLRRNQDRGYNSDCSEKIAERQSSDLHRRDEGAVSRARNGPVAVCQVMLLCKLHNGLPQIIGNSDGARGGVNQLSFRIDVLRHRSQGTSLCFRNRSVSFHTPHRERIVFQCI